MTKSVKILIIAISFCLLSILVLFFISTKKQLENKTEPIKIFSPTPILTPSSTPIITPEIKTPSFSKEPELFKKQIAAQPAITNLIPLLPFKGQYFTLDYSLHDFLFILKLDPNNPKTGMEEFNRFLKQYNIEDSSLFTNLVIL